MIASAGTELNGGPAYGGLYLFRGFGGNWTATQVLEKQANHLTLDHQGLLRMASIAVTAPLLERFPIEFCVGAVDWLGGSGFRAPRSLPVVFSRQKALSGREVER